jgi:hypothetical protein
MRKPGLARFSVFMPPTPPKSSRRQLKRAYLEGHGRIPQLLVKLHQRVLYARLCHQSTDPFCLRGLEHKVMD